MSSQIAVCYTISALLDAGKTPTAIVATLEIARSTVYTVKKMKAAGKDLGHAYAPRQKKVTTPRVWSTVQRKVKAGPTKALTRVPKEVRISRRSVTRIVKEAGGKSLRRKEVPLISAEGQERRALRAAGLVNVMKSAPARQIFFFLMKKFCCGSGLL